MTANDPNAIPPTPGPNAESTAAVQATGDRRRFIRGTAAGSIVALSVLGRPAWAGHCSHSGRMSGNLSSHDYEPCGGDGMPATYWRNHLYEWHEQWPPSMAFYHAFRVDAFPNSTLRDVIEGRRDRDVRWGDDSESDELADDAAQEDRWWREHWRGGQLLGRDDQEKLLRLLGIEAVAALQNAATPVSYVLTVPEVIDSFVQAYSSGSPGRMLLARRSLRRLNNRAG